MNFIDPSPEQAAVIVQAIHAVASAEGSIELLPVERDSITAIQHHLLRQPEPILVASRTLPADLAEVVAEPGMRLDVLRILIMLPFLDQKVLAEKAQVVERAATMLNVEDSGLDILRRAVKRQYRRITFSILNRAIRLFWSRDGKARLRDWIDMAFVVLPMLTTSKQAVRDKYQSLAEKPPGSLGRVLYTYYRVNHFPLPGEPKSFPEKFVLHEFYHIFGGYPVTHQGEMLAAAFTGGNVDKLCTDMILLSLLQYQVGARVAGLNRGIPGQLNPEEFFHAIARGAAMTVNLMEGWDFWAVADHPLEELRLRYRLPPLTSRESFTPLVIADAATA
jgi:hypothetical protein